VLVARDGKDVVEHVRALTPERARTIGMAARERILKEHTYERRGALVDVILREEVGRKRLQARVG
jgi:spore maturation protein CgeB